MYSTTLNISQEYESHVFFISLDQCTTADNLDKNLTRFWDLEMLGMSENEQHFHETLLKGFI